MELCPICDGEGENLDMARCTECDGTGLWPIEDSEELKVTGERPCSRCEGKGYHHGFGEHGHDPDWCTKCGGIGSEFVYEGEDTP